MNKIKTFRLSLLLLFSVVMYMNAASQNALVNILTRNTGIVKKGKIVYLEVTINNTDPSIYINIYKLKAQISVPGSIVSIPETGHTLPTGWTITSNTGSTINLSNGKDVIISNDARTILIAIQGDKIGGPSTVSCQLSFSNGNAPGTEPGVLQGDNPADNSSTTTIKVIK